MERVPALGFEGAIKNRQVLRLDEGRAFDRAVFIDMLGDGLDFVLGVAQFRERGGDGVVDDLHHSAAHQLLELHQGQVGLHAGRVAIHHETDGSGRSQDGSLRIPESVDRSFEHGEIPAFLRRLHQVLGTWVESMFCTAARCMRITSRKGSRFVAYPAKGPSLAAMRADCR